MNTVPAPPGLSTSERPALRVRLLAERAAFVASAIFLAWFVPYLRRRLGGATGDCLGAACYAGQLIVLLAASAWPMGATR